MPFTDYSYFITSNSLNFIGKNIANNNNKYFFLDNLQNNKYNIKKNLIKVIRLIKFNIISFFGYKILKIKSITLRIQNF